jgi:hypothetical protein
MSITIELSPETLARLQTKATAEHLSVDAYIVELITHDAEDTHDVESAELTTETELDKAVHRLIARTPEERASLQSAILAVSRPARALPAGKTLEEIVVGAWPGTETDAKISQALADLS